MQSWIFFATQRYILSLDLALPFNADETMHFTKKLWKISFQDSTHRSAKNSNNENLNWY
jgi:hypothetical protein